MKLGTIDVGKWFMHNGKWFCCEYIGTKNVKASQIGSVKVYTFSVDTEVREK